MIEDLHFKNNSSSSEASAFYAVKYPNVSIILGMLAHDY